MTTKAKCDISSFKMHQGGEKLLELLKQINGSWSCCDFATFCIETSTRVYGLVQLEQFKSMKTLARKKQFVF